MTPQEQLAFEEAMENNPELASEVREMKLVNDTIFYANLSDLKETMREDLGKSSCSNFSSGKIISGMVLLAGISGLGGYWYFSNIQEEHTTPTEVVVSDSLLNEQPQEVVIHSDEEVVPVEEETIEKTVSAASVKTPENSTEVPPVKTPPAATEKKDSTETFIPSVTDETVDSASVPAEERTVEKVEASRPETTESVISPLVNCEKTFEFIASPACKNTASGEIVVKPNEKGKYTYRIDGLENGANSTFYDLSAGKHEVIITDGVCNYKNSVPVPEKWCPQNTAFSFNPEFGERWELKHAPEDKGTFVVYNSMGKEIYKGNFGNGSGFWDGTDRDGNFVDLGLYYALIEYSDNRIEKVELTIIRK